MRCENSCNYNSKPRPFSFVPNKSENSVKIIRKITW